MNPNYQDAFQEAVSGILTIIQDIRHSDMPELHLPQLNTSIGLIEKMLEMESAKGFQKPIRELLAISMRLRNLIIAGAN